MEQLYTTPGKITIELTTPKKKEVPMWRQILKFFLYGLLVLSGLTLFNVVTSWMF